MAQPAQSGHVIRFGAFEVDGANGELRKAGISLKMHPQPLRVLLYLAERPGQMVPREEIQRCLWGENTFVDFERGINSCINQIRATLGDDPEKPRYIETLHRRGYRFIASVGVQDPAEQFLSSSAHAPNLQVVTAKNQEIIQAARKRRFVPALIAAAAMGGVCFGLYSWHYRSVEPNFQNSQLTKLTDSGKAEDAAISPDGRYVAYLYRDGEVTSLRLRQVGAQGEAQILVHESLLFPGLAFSPDGTYLYFLRTTPNDLQYKDLYVIPSLGGPERKITHNVDSAVSFSPDGRQFVYERQMPRLDSLQIRIANADGNDDRQLIDLNGAWIGESPGAAWSPDGRSVAVPVWMHNQEAHYGMDIISTANAAVREIYSGSQEIGTPRWLASGNLLVVPMRDENGGTQLWTMSYPSGKLQRLTNGLGDYKLGIDLTRDAKTLTAIQWTTTSNLWVYPSAQSSTGKQITTGEQEITEVFPLDDGKLAMLNHSNNGLWSINEDGSHPSLITDAHKAGSFAGCGPYILFESGWPGVSYLTRIDEDGSNGKRLVSGTIWGETCSPDGKYVYYAEATKPRWKIRRVPIDGGPPEDAVDNPGEVIPDQVTISPDGKLLAFPYDVEAPEPALKIAVVRLDGRNIVKTFDMPQDITAPRWSRDGRGLEYLLDRDGATNLWEQPLAGGAPTQLTKFTTGRIFDFNWTANGKELLLARGDVKGDVVLLGHLR